MPHHGVKVANLTFLGKCLSNEVMQQPSQSCHAFGKFARTGDARHVSIHKGLEQAKQFGVTARITSQSAVLLPFSQCCRLDLLTVPIEPKFQIVCKNEISKAGPITKYLFAFLSGVEATPTSLAST